jgi:hypothetical protein
MTKLIDKGILGSYPVDRRADRRKIISPDQPLGKEKKRKDKFCKKFFVNNATFSETQRLIR